MAKGVATIVRGSGISQLLILGSSPILSRIFSPEDFGIMALFAAVVGFGVIGAAGSYELAIPIPEEDERAVALFRLSLLLNVAIAIAVGLVAIGLAILPTTWPFLEELRPYVLLIPVAMIAGGIFQTMTSWSVRRRTYAAMSWSQVWQSAAQVVSGIALGLAAVRPLGLMIALVIGRCAGVATLFFRSIRSDRHVLASSTMATARAALHRYRDFPRFSLFVRLISQLGLSLPAILFVALYDPVVAGLLALTMRIIAAPMQLIGQAVGQVFLGEVSNLLRTDREAAAALTRRTSIRLALLAGPLIAVVAVVAPAAFGLVFGAEWREAGTFVRLIAPMAFMQFLTTPIAQILTILERQRLQLVLHTLRLLLAGTGVIASRSLGANAEVALFTYSISMAVMYGAFVHFSLRSIRSEEQSSVQEDEAR